MGVGVQLMHSLFLLVRVRLPVGEELRWKLGLWKAKPLILCMQSH